MQLRFWLAALALLSASVIVSAAEDGSASHDGPPGPPPEARSACEGKAIGTAVQLTAPDGRIMDGTCQLMFVPNHPPAPPSGTGGNGQQPPQ